MQHMPGSIGAAGRLECLNKVNGVGEKRTKGDRLSQLIDTPLMERTWTLF